MASRCTGTGLDRSQFGTARQITRTGIHFGVIGSPFSRFAEAFRTIKVGIDLFSLAKPTRAIGITSTHPGEGKSTTIANLAQMVEKVASPDIRILFVTVAGAWVLTPWFGLLGVGISWLTAQLLAALACIPAFLNLDGRAAA